TRLPAVPPVRPEPGVLLTSAAATHFTGILGTTHDAPEVVNVFRNSVLVTPFAFVLYVGGMTACLLRRNLRWAIVANLVIVGCLADAAYGAKLHTLWDAIFPWATLDRLLSIQYWVVPLIMAFGLVSVATVLRRLATSARSRAAAAARRPALALVSAGAAVVVVTVVSGANNDRGVYAQAVDVHGLATSADMAALRAMDHALAPGSVVLTHSSTDAGQWIDALT